MGYCIISDIAGQYDTFLALLKQMPDEEIVSVGDMIDRGPKSKEVVEFFMKHGRAILGNHEHMCVEYHKCGDYYPYGTWFHNGGFETIASFGGDVPAKIVTWMEFLPKYLEIDGCLVSHSFVGSGYTLQEVCNLGLYCSSFRGHTSIIWNRGAPARLPEYKMQIAGHNSQMGLKRFSDSDGEFAICLDASAQKVMTGLHLPSFTIYQQTYV